MKLNKNSFYLSSPLFLKTILVNIKAYRNHKNRYNKLYQGIYDSLLKNFHSNLISIKGRQRKELIRLLEECYQFSEYYSNIFKELNITIGDIQNNPYEVISKMPILSKKKRKDEVDKIVNQNPARPIREFGYTSGTTGTPTKNVMDQETQAISFALWNRFHYSIGLDKKSKSIRLSSNIIVNPDRRKPPFWIHNYIDNQLLMSVFDLKEENLKHYIKKLNSFKPVYIDGFPSAIAILATYINQNNITLDFQLKAICTTAETLYPEQRDEMEAAFGCKVFNQYASSEGSPFITECLKGNLHVHIDSGYFEFLDENDNPVYSEDQVGRMVVTSLRNWKTPLIRYDILDYAKLGADAKCECGCEFPFVKAIYGRSNDMFWTFEKGYVSGGIASAFKMVKGVENTQLIQKTPKDIIVRLVRNNEYNSASENVILNNLQERLGKQIHLTFEYVNDIPAMKSGKLKLISREFNVNDYL